MDRQQILLAKSLEAAGVPLRVDSFADRLILQKAVYLLQNAGIHMGFRFRWYLRGPYSPDMTAAAFGILGEGHVANTELASWKLDAASAGKIKELKPLLVDQHDQKELQARRLELLASVLFLIKTEQAASTDADTISAVLKKNGKNFDPSAVRTAVTELKTYGIIAEAHGSGRK